MVIIDGSHLFALSTLSLRLSRMCRWWEAGGKFLKVLQLDRRREDVRVIKGLLLAEQTAHRRGWGRRFAVASLEAMAALDGRKLLARSSHFRRICGNASALVVPLGKNAMREVLATRKGESRGRDGRRDRAISTGDCSG